MTPDEKGMVPHHGAPAYAATTWGPYYDTLHPERRVHMMAAWKLVPEWRNRASELWRQREERRRDYEAVHGSDPTQWPSQHPGVILGAKAACLRCQWLHLGGRDLEGGGFEQHWILARRHEETDGKFRGEDGEDAAT